MAAVDYFLKLDGIDGESTDSKHKGEIDVESWSWGETNSGTSASGGGAGKVQLQDFHFVMKVNKSSPQLFLRCASGKHIESALLTAVRSDKGQQEFLKWTMSDLLVSSYQTGGSSDIPTEQISLNFAKIEVEYKEQRADGSLGEGIFAGWDLRKGEK